MTKLLIEVERGPRSENTNCEGCRFFQVYNFNDDCSCECLLGELLGWKKIEDYDGRLPECLAAEKEYEYE